MKKKTISYGNHLAKRNKGDNEYAFSQNESIKSLVKVSAVVKELKETSKHL